jgi:serine/threonine protein kinase
MSMEQGTRMPLTIAGRYELGERLGHGGMADLHAATDLRLGRTVAVKRLRADLAEQATARSRFEAEARMAAGLSHPNIVTVFDSGEDGGVPFLVMELLPGRTLAHEIADGPLDVERAVDVTRAVLAALAAAHGAGIVHRDVKPSNVLLTEDGLPKVSDFGIAKVGEDSVGTATLTGELLATPAYLAPERLAGEPATPSSDLYAVGVLMYEALSGKRPFRGETPMVVLDAVKRGNAEPLSELRPGLPESIDAVVKRAMAADPAARFASADEMAAALDETRMPVDETIPLATVDGTETLALGPPPRDGHTEVLRAEPAPRRARQGGPRWWVAAVVGVILAAAAAIGIVVSRDTGGPSVDQLPATTVAVSAPALAPGASPLPQPLDHAIDQLEQSVSR